VDVVFKNQIFRDDLVDVSYKQSMGKMVGIVSIEFESRRDEVPSRLMRIRFVRTRVDGN
jgi:hypothetical protein